MTASSRPAPEKSFSRKTRAVSSALTASTTRSAFSRRFGSVSARRKYGVEGADRYRNPDDDLPSDFEVKRQEHYAALKQPQAAEEFVSGIKRSMEESLGNLNDTLPRNRKVRIVTRGKPRIYVAKIDRQPDPVNLSQLKAEVTRRWPMTGLLDVLKETDLRVGFTEGFQSVSSREVLERDELQRRLLLSLHLLQICLVYINTLMIQNVLADEAWMERMTEEDRRALTPLIHAHVTPYGLFDLDMEKRLPLEEPARWVA